MLKKCNFHENNPKTKVTAEKGNAQDVKSADLDQCVCNTLYVYVVTKNMSGDKKVTHT